MFLWLTYCMINSTKAECLFLLCMTPLCLYDSARSHFHLKDELLPRIIGKRDFDCIGLWYSAQVFLQIFCFVFQKKRSLLVCIKSDCKCRKSIVSSSNLTPTLTRVPSSYWLVLQVTVSWLESPHPYLRLCALSLNNVIINQALEQWHLSRPHGSHNGHELSTWYTKVDVLQIELYFLGFVWFRRGYRLRGGVVAQ